MSTALSHAGPDRTLTRLLELQADNAARELAVHVQRVLARHGVPADDGVDVLNGLAADDTSAAPRARELGLLEAGVRRLERLEELDELRREAAEGRDLGREERVAAGARLREEEERREPGRLELVRHVRVPDRGLHAVVKLEVVRRVRVAVHEVQLGHAVGVPGRRVDVQAPEVAAPRAEPLHGAVKELLLVPEDHHSSPGDL